MTTKVVSTIKYFGVFSLVFFTLFSCEKDIESVGVSLVDNNNFSSDNLVTEIISKTENVDRILGNSLTQNLLGVYKDDDFGKIKASIVTQLAPPVLDTYADGYGDNAEIDSVIINIPYQATREEDNSDGTPKFVIDSVFGNDDVEFNLSVYELKTFLNSLDPTDPTKSAVYYSDKEFLKGITPFYSDKFKVNPNDTVSYIKRYLNDGVTVYDTDTIKKDDLNPSINIPLDETLIKEIFIDNAANAEFASVDNFIRYFRGFYIEASELNSEYAHILSLNLSGAKMSIYYSRTQDEDTDEDLDGNGTDGETGVRTKHQYTFLFNSLTSNIINRDYSGSNLEQGTEERLYVQGAAGSIATLELFSNENLTELRANNWLVTDADLSLYIDQDASAKEVPEKLYIYNYDENEQIIDAITEGPTALGGNLERDDDGNPLKYVFKITDYVSNLLKSDDPSELVKLGIKVYDISDTPTSTTDVIVHNYGSNPQGVVLFNHNSGEKRVKLQISYTELNK
ncbi:DUF4270 domain-containing protein [Lutibacter citreus]|uniref:DUF4270 domain-containing protein n=1 Tax=Lutibacter citreus TaxID=2138210 RepID=UPI000DBE700D|nr:DUF4270 domain-containing protein [Lutibacter citreus]